MSSSRLAGSPGPPSGHADHLQASDNGTEMSRMQTGICSLELLRVKQEPGAQGLPTSGSDSWTQRSPFSLSSPILYLDSVKITCPSHTVCTRMAGPCSPLLTVKQLYRLSLFRLGGQSVTVSAPQSPSVRAPMVLATTSGNTCQRFSGLPTEGALLNSVTLASLVLRLVSCCLGVPSTVVVVGEGEGFLAGSLACPCHKENTAAGQGPLLGTCCCLKADGHEQVFWGQTW